MSTAPDRPTTPCALRPATRGPAALHTAARRTGLAGLSLALAAWLLSACTALPGPPLATAAGTPGPSAAAPAGTLLASPATTAPPAPHGAQPVAVGGPVGAAAHSQVAGALGDAPLVAVLAYAERLRGLLPAELALELEHTQRAPGQGAVAWLQLSLLHAQQQPPALEQALGLAAQAQADDSPEGRQLQALARLLAVRYAEQRRTQDLLERQARQLLELQKRLDHSLERLEALKAIERSLGQRPPGSPARPAAGNRPAERAPAP